MSRVFVTSDQHFYHKNIIRYTDRPWDFKDQTKIILDNYSDVIEDDDIVIHLGDLSANLKQHDTDEFKDILRSMKGKKILLRGNHDYQTKEFYIDAGFGTVGEYLVQGEYFFCHYPLYLNSQWVTKKDKELFDVFKASGCTTIVHGHIHNKSSEGWDDGITRINASVDYVPNRFKPIELI